MYCTIRFNRILQCDILFEITAMETLETSTFARIHGKSPCDCAVNLHEIFVSFG